MILFDAYFWWAIRTILSLILCWYFIKAYKKISYIGLLSFVGAALGETILRTGLLLGIFTLGSNEWNILLTIIGILFVIGAHSVDKTFANLVNKK